MSRFQAFFTPDDDCPRILNRLFAQAKKRVDACVFTITDDRISSAILDAAKRGVSVRIITDNEKAYDEGSDVPRFRAAGIPLKVDESAYHMHHKFALFDGAVLVTGSYNWTRGAAEHNLENFIVTDESSLVEAYKNAFERLWKKLP